MPEVLFSLFLAYEGLGRVLRFEFLLLFVQKLKIDGGGVTLPFPLHSPYPIMGWAQSPTIEFLEIPRTTLSHFQVALGIIRNSKIKTLCK